MRAPWMESIEDTNTRALTFPLSVGDLSAPSGSLDSNLKKNTAFIKRVRQSLALDSRDQLLKEVQTLSLEKYLEEIVQAVPDGLAKCASVKDCWSAVEVRSAIRGACWTVTEGRQRSSRRQGGHSHSEHLERMQARPRELKAISVLVLSFYGDVWAPAGPQDSSDPSATSVLTRLFTSVHTGSVRATRPLRWRGILCAADRTAHFAPGAIATWCRASCVARAKGKGRKRTCGATSHAFARGRRSCHC